MCVKGLGPPFCCNRCYAGTAYQADYMTYQAIEVHPTPGQVQALNQIGNRTENRLQHQIRYQVKPTNGYYWMQTLNGSFHGPAANGGRDPKLTISRIVLHLVGPFFFQRVLENESNLASTLTCCEIIAQASVWS